MTRKQLDPRISGVNWCHSITKGNVSMVTIMDSIVKAEVKVISFSLTYALAS